MSGPQLPVRSTPNAMIQLGSDQIAVRIEGGFSTRMVQVVRLELGTHIYYAGKGEPRIDEKINMDGAGYMRLAAACGAILTVPPVVQNPVTGEPEANPKIEFVKKMDGTNSSMIQSISAVAVCIVRDNIGNIHSTAMMARLDAEHALRQAILKLPNRDELVQFLSHEDVAADKAAGKLRGWYVLPFSDGFCLCAKMIPGGPVWEAAQTYNNLGATIIQRLCTRTKRLAAHHNPVLQRVWLYGELLRDISAPDGKVSAMKVADGIPDRHIQVSPAYALVEAVSWADSRDKAAMDSFIKSMSKLQPDTDAGDIIFDADEDADPVDEALSGAAPRQITEQVQAPTLVIPTRQPEPVAVQAPAPEPAPVAAPAPIQAPAPVPAPAPAAPINGQAILRLQGKCKGMEAQLPPADVAYARKEAGVAVDADLDEIRDGAALERLCASLKTVAAGVQ